MSAFVRATKPGTATKRFATADAGGDAAATTTAAPDQRRRGYEHANRCKRRRRAAGSPRGTEDLPAVERLLTASGLPLDGVREALPAFLVAEAGATLVGVAGLEACCDNALLRSVAVSPSWRSQGLGRALVTRIISRRRGAGDPRALSADDDGGAVFPELRFSGDQSRRRSSGRPRHGGVSRCVPGVGDGHVSRACRCRDNRALGLGVLISPLVLLSRAASRRRPPVARPHSQ